MSWNYNGDPSASDKDTVRFDIGDTECDDQLLQDEEIEYALTQEGSVLAASARCCEAIARKFARQADFTLGPQAIRASQRSQAYYKMAQDLRNKANILSQGNGLYVGGIDPADEAKDVDLIPPAFKRRFMDNI